jgi:hypothetical protein
MDRETGEMRSFRTDRIVSYTVHRTAYTVTRPAADETKSPSPPASPPSPSSTPSTCPIPGRVQLLADALAA